MLGLVKLRPLISLGSKSRIIYSLVPTKVTRDKARRRRRTKKRLSIISAT